MLTARFVASRQLKDGLYADGHNLYLQVRGGGRSWVYRYQRDGRVRTMGLGSVRDISLADARAKAAECRRLLVAGRDPLAVRAHPAGLTLAQAADLLIAAHAPAWSRVHHQQWTSSLERFVYPRIGDVPVADVGIDHVMSVLDPIWHRLPETASRVRGRIERILDWARARGYRAGENPARWRGHLKELLPSRARLAAVQHHHAVDWHQVPDLCLRLSTASATAHRALLFTVLTAARTGEVRGMAWSEVVGDVWVIPAARMKSRREHRVPLSAAAQAVLAGVPRLDERVFAGLGANAMRLALQALVPDVTTHGMRSAFRDWAGEATSFPREVVEMALAHVVGTATERAYARGDLFNKRKALMEAWGGFCLPHAEEVRCLR